MSENAERDSLRLRRKPQLFKDMEVTQADVGKIFVLSPDETSGKIMTREAFLSLPLSQMKGWYEIDEFDINF